MSLENIIINPIEQNEIKQFDDIYFPQYRETNSYITPKQMFEVLINDLFEYIKHVENNNEIKIGYIIFSKMYKKSSTMNNILNMLVQKSNPNIRVQSQWFKEITFNSQVQTDKGVQTVDVDKIKIKIVVKNNDKDFAIKKLADINLNHLKKKDKRICEYLDNK
jgi:hypothetical protein